MYEQIPQELKDLPQWVCWRFVEDPSRPEKPRKLPIDARTGQAAQSNNPATWRSFREAEAASARYDGIGFMFDGGIFGVDIDGVEAEIADYREGGVDNIVAEFIDSLGSYAEYSVSGRGIHILCRGRLPPGGRRRGNVEMYENGRFFIMTGNPASTYTRLADCTERIRPLHERYIGGGRAPSLTGRPAGQEMTDMDDAELIRLASQSRQGRLFPRRTWRWPECWRSGAAGTRRAWTGSSGSRGFTARSGTGGSPAARTGSSPFIRPRRRCGTSTPRARRPGTASASRRTAANADPRTSRATRSTTRATPRGFRTRSAAWSATVSPNGAGITSTRAAGARIARARCAVW